MGSGSITSIVISHYLSPIVNECLQSLWDAHDQDLPEILLVDDRPHNDGSIETARQQFPFIKVIQGKGAAGYGAASNQGLLYSTKEFVVFLNNDVKVSRGWLDPAIEVLRGDPKLAAVFPKILQDADKEWFDPAGAGGGLDVLGYPYCLGQVCGYPERDQGQYDREREVFWGFGGAMIVRRAHVLKVGGFDPTFFMQMEEVDLCWRLRLQGFGLKSVPSSRVFHRGGWSRQIAQYDKTSLDHCNSLRMIAKNLSFLSLALVLPIRLMCEVAAMLAAGFALKRPRYGLSVLSGFVRFLVMLPQTLRDRAHSQRQRRVSDWTILRHMSLVPSPFARFILGLNTATELEALHDRLVHLLPPRLRWGKVSGGTASGKVGVWRPQRRLLKAEPVQ